MTIHELVSMFKEYRWNSILIKYFKTAFIGIFIPIVLMYSFILFYYGQSYKKDQINMATEMSDKVIYQLESMFGLLNSAAQYCNTDKTVFQYLTTNDDITTFQNASALKNALTQYPFGMDNEYVDSAYLYSFKNDYVFSTKYSSSKLENFFDLTWYEHYMSDHTGNVVYSTSRYSSVVPNILSIIYPIDYGTMRAGILVYNIDVGYFFGNMLNRDSNAVIYDMNKNIVCSANDKYIDNIKSEKYSGFVNVCKEIEDTTISLGIVTRRKGFASNASNMVFIVSLLFACILISVVISMYVSRVCYNFITKIITNIQCIINGDAPREDEYEEIAGINKNILSVVTKTKQVEDELSKKIVELNKANANAMQMQINPHFLFNTLNTINDLAMIYGNNETLSRMILLLSDILEEVLDTQNTVVPLSSEIKYTEKYVELMLIKEMNRVEIEWDIPEELREQNVMKFYMQPLVENAFVHGIKHLAPDCEKKIGIKVFKSGDDIITEVSDTGSDISKEKLEYIQRDLRDAFDMPDRHIGLHNTNLRIKLAFGSEYGCELIRREGRTISRVRLPYKTDEF